MTLAEAPEISEIDSASDSDIFFNMLIFISYFNG
jgi:hypothetical protein